MLVCSICAGVFNVNPQSGIEFPKRSGGGDGGGGALLIVQLKGRAISGHMGPRLQRTIKRERGVHPRRTSCPCRAAGRIRHATNWTGQTEASLLFCRIAATPLV